METQPSKLEDGTDREADVDVWNPWNLPRAVAVPSPSLDEWHERERRAEKAHARAESGPGA